VPGVGFAAGLDRVVLTMEQQGCSFGKRACPQAFVLCEADTRAQGSALLAALRSATRGVRVACIFGGNEAARGVVALKDLRTGTQESVPQEELAARVGAILKG